MPTYDYKCNACGHEFELFQQMTEPVKRKCPECGKPKLERLIGTGAGVLFKGGGFYETDYRSDNYTKAAEADKKAAEPKTESAQKPAGASTDAKPKHSGAGADTSSKTGADQSAGAGASSARKPSRSSSNTSAKAKPRRRK